MLGALIRAAVLLIKSYLSKSVKVGFFFKIGISKNQLLEFWFKNSVFLA